MITKDHDCIANRCTPEQHYGSSDMGLCLVCGACFDPECCWVMHDSDCYSKSVELMQKAVDGLVDDVKLQRVK